MGKRRFVAVATICILATCTAMPPAAWSVSGADASSAAAAAAAAAAASTADAANDAAPLLQASDSDSAAAAALQTPDSAAGPRRRPLQALPFLRPRPPGKTAPAAGPRVKPAAFPAKYAGQPAAERARELVAKLTLEEKLTQLHNRHDAVPRLGLPAYDFLNECLHGFWEPDPAAKPPTLFPQPLAMAAAFDRDLVRRAFDAIADEMRAKNNAVRAARGESYALTCWTPHINIFRDARWGRGSETWGEDPYLTSVMAASVVKGLQGGGEFLKVAATCKHFFGYSLELAEGQSRYSFDAKIPPQDLADTYLPAFEACVRASKAAGVMCAYNAADNGVPQCANAPRMHGLLRGKWGFDGYVVSDCNAVAAFVWGHRTSPDDAHALGAAVAAGTDVLCDNMDTEKAAAGALQRGLLKESDIDAALARTYAIRFRTGQFEPPAALPWAGLGLDVVNSEAHRKLAREAAVKGIVLLKNDAPPPAARAGGGSGSGSGSKANGGVPALLPLDRSKLKKVCVVGPLADSPEHLLGNYYGVWDKKLTASPLAAVREALKGAAAVVTSDNAFKIMGANYYDWPLESALEACRGADAALVFAGGSMAAKGAVSEGEGIDREGLELPGRQMDLIRALAERNPGTPVALVLIAGGPVDVAWAQAAANVPAIVVAGFPGQEGGRAIADILFGAAAPSGRLPVTWPFANFTHATPITDMGLRPDPTRGYPGRTYRFVSQPGYAQYPFGHGLSYTTFSYSSLAVEPVKASGGKCAGYEDAAFCLAVTVTNTGSRAGEDVVLVYLSNVGRAGTNGFPLKSLRAFGRTPPLAPGASAELRFPLGTLDFSVPNAAGEPVVRLGRWRASVGGGAAPLLREFDVAREALNLKSTATVRWTARSAAAAAKRAGA